MHIGAHSAGISFSIIGIFLMLASLIGKSIMHGIIGTTITSYLHHDQACT